MSIVDTKQLLECRRCGGQVLRFSDDINCLQCGAPHTKKGKPVTYSVQEPDNYLPSKRNIKIEVGVKMS
jgi:ribosomal protein L37E